MGDGRQKQCRVCHQALARKLHKPQVNQAQLNSVSDLATRKCHSSGAYGVVRLNGITVRFFGFKAAVEERRW
jgi:hypothetical protein